MILNAFVINFNIQQQKYYIITANLLYKKDLNEYYTLFLNI